MKPSIKLQNMKDGKMEIPVKLHCMRYLEVLPLRWVALISQRVFM